MEWPTILDSGHAMLPCRYAAVALLLLGGLNGASRAVAAPQSRLSTRADGGAFRTVQTAYDQLAGWLASSSHEQAWRDYLGHGELEQQLRLGDAADREVVARILRRYSLSAAGLEYRRFVAVRLALRDWLSELSVRDQLRPPAAGRIANRPTILPASYSPILAVGPFHALAASSPLALTSQSSHLAPRDDLLTQSLRTTLTNSSSSAATPLRGPSVAPAPAGAAASYSPSVRLAHDSRGATVHRFHGLHRLFGRRGWGVTMDPWGGEASGPIPSTPLIAARSTAPGHALPKDDPQRAMISENPAQETASYNAADSVVWHDDYAAACREARRRQALLFISFHEPQAAGEAVQQDDLLRLATQRRHRYVWARLPLDHRTNDAGRDIRLLDHAAFAELRGRPGMAIIDYESPAAPHYKHVVSLFPQRSQPYNRGELAVILDLPPGTLTQRTMIYAVRTHPDAPRSAVGLPHHELLRESELHSKYQADISVQGHHDWGGRFDRINAALGDLSSREVVAESWPGESLLEAAIECVHCWRQSEGHWDAVSSPHAEYGYDMKLSGNGIWYATGLFGD
jgi:hypothetical protein